MPFALESSVLRVVDSQGSIIGTAFLVAPSLAVTCAHVVEDVHSAPGGTLQLTFARQEQALSAFVLPEGYSSSAENDLAFLRLDSPPPGSLPLSLGRDASSFNGREFASYGFAPVGSLFEERHAGGALGGLVWAGNFAWLQLEGAKFEQGMSGAPVVDRASGLVVGMFSMFPRALKADFAYATPVEALWSRWPAEVPRPFATDLVGSLRQVETGYRGGLEDFLKLYLGTPEQPVLFGGREPQLAELDRWLQDPRAPAFGLLAARAGRGKSALLCRWAQSLVERSLGRVIFHPISLRLAIHRPETVYLALAVRLGELQGEPVSRVTVRVAKAGVRLVQRVPR